MRMPPSLRPHGFDRGEMGAGIKPAGQDRPAREGSGLPRERGKYRLRHILGQVRVAVDLPERRRINEREMPLDQFGEGAFGMGFRVAAEQFTIRYHLQPMVPGQSKTAQKRFWWQTKEGLPKAGGASGSSGGRPARQKRRDLSDSEPAVEFYRGKFSLTA